ncbi:MAG TPA: HNH endonuclease [Solirubrobacteraceae bacterium]|nr:HNH endonuclease [Solirubrobacteraceae bacterium]
MVCKHGRPQLTQDQEQQLFAESAGTCLLCNAPLFKKRVDGRALSIAERSHIVAHSEKGPRGNVRMPVSSRSNPENIVLLCPTCHTIVDKDPIAYPTKLLLARKQRRAAAVAGIGGVPTFGSRSDARNAVEAILDRNETIFRAIGPDPLDGSLPSTEAAAKWRDRVLEDIVPGNELIVAIVGMNRDLAVKSDRTAAELLRLHTQDLARKHRGGEIIGCALRFPQQANQIFAGDS